MIKFNLTHKRTGNEMLKKNDKTYCTANFFHYLPMAVIKIKITFRLDNRKFQMQKKTHTHTLLHQYDKFYHKNKKSIERFKNVKRHPDLIENARDYFHQPQFAIVP